MWCTELPYDGNLLGLQNLEETDTYINDSDDDEKSMQTSDKLHKIAIKQEDGVPIKMEDDALNTLLDAARQQPGVLQELLEYTLPPLHTGEAPGQNSRTGRFRRM